MKMFLLVPFASMHVINLVVLYEKTGLREVRDMYHYVIERLLDKFNEHLQRRGIRIGLLDFLAYDDYLVKPGYQDISIMGGEESFDGRVEALREIPTNVVLVASASPEEEQEKFVPSSPCMSRFISNMVSGDIVDDELLTKIIYAVLDWMGNLFKTSVPNPVKERDAEVFDKFAKEAITPEFIESLRQCSKETKDKFEKFIKMLNWDEGRILNLKMLSENLGSEKGVEISSPLKWVLPKEGSQCRSPPCEKKEDGPKKYAEPSSDEEGSSVREDDFRKKPDEAGLELSSKEMRKARLRRKRPRGGEEETSEVVMEEEMWNDGHRARDLPRKSNVPAKVEVREEPQRIVLHKPHPERRRPDRLVTLIQSPHEKHVDGSSRGLSPNHVISLRSIPREINGNLSYGRIPYRKNRL